MINGIEACEQTSVVRCGWLGVEEWTARHLAMEDSIDESTAPEVLGIISDY